MVEHFHRIIFFILISSIALAQDNQGNNDESDQMEQLEALDIEVAKRERPSTKTAPAPIIEKKITADDLVLPRGLEKDLVNLSKDESLEGKEFIQQEIRNNLFKENFRALSLSDVIEEGLRQNHQVAIQPCYQRHRRVLIARGTGPRS